MKPLKTVSERLQDTLSFVTVPTVRIAVPGFDTRNAKIANRSNTPNARRELLEQYQSDYASIVRDERHFRTRPRLAESRSAL